MKISKLLVLGIIVTSLCMAGSAFGSAIGAEKRTVPVTPNIYDIGDTIYYEMVVYNPLTLQDGSPQTATNTLTRIWDTLPDGTVIEFLGPGENLVQAPGDTKTYNAQYVVQESDIQYIEAFGAYGVRNTFEAEGYDTEADDVYARVTRNSRVNLPEPCIEITKVVDCDVATVGAEITYTYCIYNCGPLELEVTALVDDVVGNLLADFYAANGNSYLLAPDDGQEGGADEVCFTVNYTILESDDDPLINEVRVDAIDTLYEQTVYATDDAEVDIVNPDFTVVKECLTDPVPEGEDAEFQITITNTGDVDLVVTLDEDVLDGQDTITAGDPILLAQSAILSFTVLVPVIEGDVDVDNEVEVCATLLPDTEICYDPEDFPICKSASDTCSVQALCYGDETAWAYGEDDANPNWNYVKNKFWGWTNGPLPEGIYVWDVYAGAGQNDLSKGTIVGTLYVDYDDGCVTVGYEVDEGYYLGETHLWIGDTPLPMVGKGKKAEPTNSPGLFPYGVNYGFDPEDSDTWQTEWSSGEICGFTGDIYVAAHAVVWMEVECPEEPEEPTIVE